MDTSKPLSRRLSVRRPSMSGAATGPSHLLFDLGVQAGGTWSRRGARFEVRRRRPMHSSHSWSRGSRPDRCPDHAGLGHGAGRRAGANWHPQAEVVGGSGEPGLPQCEARRSRCAQPLLRRNTRFVEAAALSAWIFDAPRPPAACCSCWLRLRSSASRNLSFASPDVPGDRFSSMAPASHARPPRVTFSRW